MSKARDRSLGIFRGDELLGVFCIRLPPASQPVSLAETEKKMSIAKAERPSQGIPVDEN